MRTRSAVLLAAAALACLTALAPAPAAADPPARWGYGYGDDDDDDYDDHRGRGRGHRDDDDEYDDDRRDRRRDHYRRDDYGYDPYRSNERHDRRRDYGYNSYGYGYERWDYRVHNGYYYRDTWYWGPPPEAYYRDCRPDYRRLERGARLPRGYVVIPVDDWRYHGLYAPPRGHGWARDESGTYFLLGLATGVILDSVLRGY